ncbi:MAG TPA: hypothetical protein VNF74_05720 [Terriglobales bacterium]|nr:hypothetical protein [Terriglobales bacterium]
MIGLPSLDSLDAAASARIWLATEPADMRCGFGAPVKPAGGRW